jgi:hypothetical protein
MSTRWDSYTVTLNNKVNKDGIVSGTISYSEVTCGDHLVLIKDCGCRP